MIAFLLVDAIVSGHKYILMLYFVEQNKIKGEFSAGKGTLHPIMIKGT